MAMDHRDLGARAEIEDMIVAWAWLIDHGDATNAATLFTDDAEVHVGGASSIGIDAIRDALARRGAMTGRVSRHVISNLRLARSSDGEISGSWVLTLYRSDDAERRPTPLSVCDVEDTYRRDIDGRWRTARRRVVPIFADAP